MSHVSLRVGLAAWGWLVLDANWQILLVGLCLLGLVAGSLVWMGGTAEVVETEEVGALTVTMAGSPEATDSHPNLYLPADGVYPLLEGDRIEVRSTFEQVGDAGIEDADLTLTISQVIARETTHGTLWRERSVLEVEPGSDSLETVVTIDLTDVHSRAAEIDAALQTSSGSVVVEVEAVITATDAIERPLVATASLEPMGDMLRFDPRVRESLREPIAVPQGPPRWAVFSLPIALGGTAIILALVSTGSVPLEPCRRRYHRSRWIRWYHHRYLIEVPTVFELSDDTPVDHPGTLVRLAKRTDRPICVDRRGVLVLDLDDDTFVWPTTPAFKGEDEQSGRSTCQSHDEPS